MNKRSGLINLVFVGAPLLVTLPALTCAWLESHWRGAGTYFSLLVVLAGFVAFAVAKSSRFAQGRWIAFGTGDMAPWARLCYALGYTCMAFGLVGLLFTMAVFRGIAGS